MVKSLDFWIQRNLGSTLRSTFTHKAALGTLLNFSKLHSPSSLKRTYLSDYCKDWNKVRAGNLGNALSVWRVISTPVCFSGFCSLIPVHLFVPRFVRSLNDDFQMSQSEMLKPRTPQSAAALSKAKLVWEESFLPYPLHNKSYQLLVFLGTAFICIEQQVPVFILEQLPVSVQLLWAAH